MALFDLLGRHWAMGIVWNLNDGACTFRELQARCEFVSPTVLNKRIRELRGAGIVEDAPGGYALTRSGRRLYDLLLPLGKWSKSWAKSLRGNDRD
jgi:DNA-binding HxlR family transcriptional regulator